MSIVDKENVRVFWNREACGEIYARGEHQRDKFESHARERYRLEPYLLDFGRFSEVRSRDVLEVGVGFGADHVELARSQPASLRGIDLTQRAIDSTKERLGCYGLDSTLSVADAEHLPFDDNSFDFVWSWGVIHHTPNTERAAAEIVRVLRPGGIARVMIYHRASLVGYMLWLRYGLGRLRPRSSLDEIYAKYLESPGTKAYSVPQAERLFALASDVQCQVRLGFGDLLMGGVGQRHRGIVLDTARALWPRALIQKRFSKHGLCLLIEVTK
jgi:SAM-dependent methyltransferase